MKKCDRCRNGNGYFYCGHEKRLDEKGFWYNFNKGKPKLKIICGSCCDSNQRNHPGVLYNPQCKKDPIDCHINFTRIELIK